MKSKNFQPSVSAQTKHSAVSASKFSTCTGDACMILNNRKSSISAQARGVERCQNRRLARGMPV